MTAPFPSLEALRDGGKRALARALTRIETNALDAETVAFLDGICMAQSAHVLGLTGPPGVGKSSLTNALLTQYRAAGKRVGVLAVDPSSTMTGGALLGDRTRLSTDPEDTGVFVRSMAARDRLGGLSDQAFAATVLLRATCDVVIVETVGIGQSEGDLRQSADTVVLCIQPGSGDSLQFMKAGIMELPDIVVVTKADLGDLARKASADVLGALSLAVQADDGWAVPVCDVSAKTQAGVAELRAHADAHHEFLLRNGTLSENRQRQHVTWFRDMVRSEFGNKGLRLLESDAEARSTTRARREPFASYLSFCSQLACD